MSVLTNMLGKLLLFSVLHTVNKPRSSKTAKPKLVQGMISFRPF
jgi:hypothetical protein